MDWSVFIWAFIGGAIGAAISGFAYDRRYQKQLAKWRREKELEEARQWEQRQMELAYLMYADDEDGA